MRKKRCDNLGLFGVVLVCGRQTRNRLKQNQEAKTKKMGPIFDRPHLLNNQLIFAKLVSSVAKKLKQHDEQVDEIHVKIQSAHNRSLANHFFIASNLVISLFDALSVISS